MQKMHILLKNIKNDLEFTKYAVGNNVGYLGDTSDFYWMPWRYFFTYIYVKCTWKLFHSVEFSHGIIGNNK